MMRSLLVATTLAVVLLGVAQRFNPAGGLAATYHADSHWSPASITATSRERPSTAVLNRAWLGAPPPQFSASWSGSFLALRHGAYTFSTVSDDGSWLYVDGQLIVDNGGSHGPVEARGTVTLTRGTHAILIGYRQDGEAAQLTVLMGRDGRPLREIPNWALSPRTPAFWTFVGAAALRVALTAAVWLWAGALFVAAVTAAPAAIASFLTGLSRRQRRRLVAVVALVMCFAVLGVLGAHENSLTYDESDHYKYGMNILEGDSTRFEDSEMPVSALNALPGWIASGLPSGLVAETLGSLPTARLVTVAFSSLVALLVFYWSRSLYGFYPALASLFLFVFDPNVIAHAQLVTTDLYAAGTITLAFYCLWRVAHRRTAGNALLCGVALGLSLLAKYTAIVLVPLFVLLIVLFDARAWWLSRGSRASTPLTATARRYARWGLVVIGTSALILNFGFLFNGSFTHLGDYRFKSELFAGLQTRFAALSGLPIPLPYPYLQGLDWVVALERSGESFGSVYLLGELRNGEGFKGYYLVASLLKVPLATQLVTLAAVLVYLFSSRRRARFLSDEMFLLVPIGALAVYFNFFFDAQIGMRYYLALVPMLYVFAGHLFAHAQRLTVIQKVAVGVLMSSTVISVLSYHPSYLAYFNEIVWDRRRAYEYLADSNLDWGQGSSKLDEYLSAHPAAVYRPNRPVAGVVVVSVNDLVGVLGDVNQFAWLRENFEPAGTIAYSYLIFQVSAEDLARYCASADRC